jgi:hypothetical protein
VNKLAFSAFSNLTGGASADTFMAGSSGSLTGTLNGGGAPNTLIGPNVASTFNITGNNAGNLGITIPSFTNIQSLTGGTQPNTFVFSNGAAITGSLSGGAGGDTLDESAYTTAVAVNLQTSKVTGVGGTATNLIAAIGGSASNTLSGVNTTNTWNITASNAGNLNSSFTFTHFGNLVGGSQPNDFVFGASGSLTGNIIDGSSTTGDALDFSAYTTAIVTLDLQTKKATPIGGTFSKIATAIGQTSTTADTLTGVNAANSWTISGTNSGTVGTVTFSNFGTLTGGTGNDTFSFDSGGSLTGSVVGGGGTDTLDYSANGGAAIAVDLQTKTAPAIGGTFSGIAALTGSTASTNTLTGANSSNAWSITGANAGKVNSFTFSNIENLVGGAGIDVFTFSSTGTVAAIDGGGAPAHQGDWLDYSSFTTAVTVDLSAGAATNVNGGAAGSVSNVQNVHGGNTLNGNSQGNILIGGSGANTITGGSGRRLLIADRGASNITGGSDGSPSGGDILIAGSTSYDSMTSAHEAALMSILAEWQSADSYATRFHDINTGSGGGLNGTNKLNYGMTVLDNGQVNTLTAEAGTAAVDWLFANQTAGHTTILTQETGEHVNNN